MRIYYSFHLVDELVYSYDKIAYLNWDCKLQKTPLVSKFNVGNKNARYLSRRRTATRASMQPSDSGSSEFPVAPLQMESPIGQFLSQILASHPHLVPAAVEQQLEQLQTDCEAEKEKEEPSASGTDLVLYR